MRPPSRTTPTTSRTQTPSKKGTTSNTTSNSSNARVTQQSPEKDKSKTPSTRNRIKEEIDEKGSPSSSSNVIRSKKGNSSTSKVDNNNNIYAVNEAETPKRSTRSNKKSAEDLPVLEYELFTTPVTAKQRGSTTAASRKSSRSSVVKAESPVKTIEPSSPVVETRNKRKRDHEDEADTPVLPPSKRKTLKVELKTSAVEAITSPRTTPRRRKSELPDIETDDAIPVARSRSSSKATTPKRNSFASEAKSAEEATITSFFQAIRENDEEMVTSLLEDKNSGLKAAQNYEQKPPFDDDDETISWNALHCAASYGHLNLIKLLVETYKVPVEKKDATHKGTAVGWATFGLHYLAAKMLVCKYNANPQITNRHGQSPLDLMEEPVPTEWKELLEGRVPSSKWDDKKDFQEWEASTRNKGKANANPELNALIDSILKRLTLTKDRSGRNYCAMFFELPEKSEYPDYYRVIKKPMTFTMIEENVKKGIYNSVEEFANDVLVLFENAMTYNEEGSLIFKDSQFLLNKFLLDLKERANYEVPKSKRKSSLTELMGVIPLPEDRVYVPVLEQDADKGGLAISIGDFVHVPNPELENNRASVVLVERLFTDRKAPHKKYFTGCWFFFPEQTFHPPTRKFIEREVFKTNHTRDEQLSEITGRCYVMHIRDYVRFYPEGFDLNEQVYVCESKYAETTKNISPVKDWKKILGVEALNPPPLRMYNIPRKIIRNVDSIHLNRQEELAPQKVSIPINENFHLSHNINSNSNKKPLFPFNQTAFLNFNNNSIINSSNTSNFGLMNSHGTSNQLIMSKIAANRGNSNNNNRMMVSNAPYYYSNSNQFLPKQVPMDCRLDEITLACSSKGRLESSDPHHHTHQAGDNNSRPNLLIRIRNPSADKPPHAKSIFIPSGYVNFTLSVSLDEKYLVGLMINKNIGSNRRDQRDNSDDIPLLVFHNLNRLSNSTTTATTAIRSSTPTPINNSNSTSTTNDPTSKKSSSRTLTFNLNLLPNVNVIEIFLKLPPPTQAATSNSNNKSSSTTPPYSLIQCYSLFLVKG